MSRFDEKYKQISEADNHDYSYEELISKYSDKSYDELIAEANSLIQELKTNIKDMVDRMDEIYSPRCIDEEKARIRNIEEMCYTYGRLISVIDEVLIDKR